MPHFARDLGEVRALEIDLAFPGSAALRGDLGLVLVEQLGPAIFADDDVVAQLVVQLDDSLSSAAR